MVSPGPAEREHDRLVRLRARMRLDVGVGRAEQAPGAFDRKPLRHIDPLAAAVVAPAGIALGVFVGEDGTLRLHHRPGNDVLRGDQLDPVALPLAFPKDRSVDLAVAVGERHI